MIIFFVYTENLIYINMATFAVLHHTFQSLFLIYYLLLVSLVSNFE